MVLHRKGNRVDHDQDEDRVLERLRGDEPPHFVLDAVFGDVPFREDVIKQFLYFCFFYFILRYNNF